MERSGSMLHNLITFTHRRTEQLWRGARLITPTSVCPPQNACPQAVMQLFHKHLATFQGAAKGRVQTTAMTVA